MIKKGAIVPNTEAFAAVSLAKEISEYGDMWRDDSEGKLR